jgi:hypothetical protein
MDLREELKAVLGDRPDEELLKIALGSPVVIAVRPSPRGSRWPGAAMRQADSSRRGERADARDFKRA